MSKICKNCGTHLSDEGRFCNNCGGTDFFPIDNGKQTTSYNHTYQQPQQYQQNTPFQQQPQYQQNTPFQQQPQYQQNNSYSQAPNSGVQVRPQQPAASPKKKNSSSIIAIIASVIIILALIGGIAEKVLQNKGYGDNKNEKTTVEDVVEDEVKKIEYTKGEFDGFIYTNEWADIKIHVPSEYSDAGEEYYKASENDTTDCGIYLVNEDNTKLMFICFEKIPTYPKFTEETYMSTVLKHLNNTDGLECVIPDVENYKRITIAGKSYLYARALLNNGISDIVQEYFVRSIDNYMIVFCTTGLEMDSNDNLEATNDFINSISTFK